MWLGMVQVKRRDIHWEIYLVHNLDLRESPLGMCQVENLRFQYWYSLLVHTMELR